MHPYVLSCIPPAIVILLPAFLMYLAMARLPRPYLWVLGYVVYVLLFLPAIRLGRAPQDFFGLSVYYVVESNYSAFLIFIGIPLILLVRASFVAKKKQPPEKCDGKKNREGTCASCGCQLQDGSVSVVFGEDRVCPKCKHDYVQRLKEGADQT